MTRFNPPVPDDEPPTPYNEPLTPMPTTPLPMTPGPDELLPDPPPSQPGQKEVEVDTVSRTRSGRVRKNRDNESLKAVDTHKLKDVNTDKEKEKEKDKNDANGKHNETADEDTDKEKDPAQPTLRRRSPRFGEPAPAPVSAVAVPKKKKPAKPKPSTSSESATDAPAPPVKEPEPAADPRRSARLKKPAAEGEHPQKDASDASKETTAVEQPEDSADVSKEAEKNKDTRNESDKDVADKQPEPRSEAEQPEKDSAPEQMKLTKPDEPNKPDAPTEPVDEEQAKRTEPMSEVEQPKQLEKPTDIDSMKDAEPAQKGPSDDAPKDDPKEKEAAATTTDTPADDTAMTDVASPSKLKAGESAASEQLDSLPDVSGAEVQPTEQEASESNLPPDTSPVLDTDVTMVDTHTGDARPASAALSTPGAVPATAAPSTTTPSAKDSAPPPPPPPPPPQPSARMSMTARGSKRAPARRLTRSYVAKEGAMESNRTASATDSDEEVRQKFMDLTSGLGSITPLSPPRQTRQLARKPRSVNSSPSFSPRSGSPRPPMTAPQVRRRPGIIFDLDSPTPTQSPPRSGSRRGGRGGRGGKSQGTTRSRMRRNSMPAVPAKRRPRRGRKALARKPVKGDRLRIRWHIDNLYYEGVVDSVLAFRQKRFYDLTYTTGEKEYYLDLTHRTWHFADAEEEEEENDVPPPDYFSIDYSDYPQTGDRIEVMWHVDGKFYPGKVNDILKQPNGGWFYDIDYDGGDREFFLDLTIRKWRKSGANGPSGGTQSASKERRAPRGAKRVARKTTGNSNSATGRTSAAAPKRKRRSGGRLKRLEESSDEYARGQRELEKFPAPPFSEDDDPFMPSPLNTVFPSDNAHVDIESIPDSPEDNANMDDDNLDTLNLNSALGDDGLNLVDDMEPPIPSPDNNFGKRPRSAGKEISDTMTPSPPPKRLKLQESGTDNPPQRKLAELPRKLLERPAEAPAPSSGKEPDGVAKPSNAGAAEQSEKDKAAPTVEKPPEDSQASAKASAPTTPVTPATTAPNASSTAVAPVSVPGAHPSTRPQTAISSTSVPNASARKLLVRPQDSNAAPTVNPPLPPPRVLKTREQLRQEREEAQRIARRKVAEIVSVAGMAARKWARKNTNHLAGSLRQLHKDVRDLKNINAKSYRRYSAALRDGYTGGDELSDEGESQLDSLRSNIVNQVKRYRQTVENREKTLKQNFTILRTRLTEQNKGISQTAQALSNLDIKGIETLENLTPAVRQKLQLSSDGKPLMNTSVQGMPGSGSYANNDSLVRTLRRKLADLVTRSEWLGDEVKRLQGRERTLYKEKKEAIRALDQERVKNTSISPVVPPVVKDRPSSIEPVVHRPTTSKPIGIVKKRKGPIHSSQVTIPAAGKARKNPPRANSKYKEVLPPNVQPQTHQVAPISQPGLVQIPAVAAPGHVTVNAAARTPIVAHPGQRVHQIPQQAPRQMQHQAPRNIAPQTGYPVQRRVHATPGVPQAAAAMQKAVPPSVRTPTHPTQILRKATPAPKTPVRRAPPAKTIPTSLKKQPVQLKKQMNKQVSELLALTYSVWLLQDESRSEPPKEPGDRMDAWVQACVKKCLQSADSYLTAASGIMSARRNLRDDVDGEDVYTDWILAGPNDDGPLELSRKNYALWEPSLKDVEWLAEKRVLRGLNICHSKALAITPENNFSGTLMYARAVVARAVQDFNKFMPKTITLRSSPAAVPKIVAPSKTGPASTVKPSAKLAAKSVVKLAPAPVPAPTRSSTPMTGVTKPVATSAQAPKATVPVAANTPVSGKAAAVAIAKKPNPNAPNQAESVPKQTEPVKEKAKSNSKPTSHPFSSDDHKTVSIAPSFSEPPTPGPNPTVATESEQPQSRAPTAPSAPKAPTAPTKAAEKLTEAVSKSKVVSKKPDFAAEKPKAAAEETESSKETSVKAPTGDKPTTSATTPVASSEGTQSEALSAVKPAPGSSPTETPANTVQSESLKGSKGESTAQMAQKKPTESSGSAANATPKKNISPKETTGKSQVESTFKQGTDNGNDNGNIGAPEQSSRPKNSTAPTKSLKATSPVDSAGKAVVVKPSSDISQKAVTPAPKTPGKNVSGDAAPASSSTKNSAQIASNSQQGTPISQSLPGRAAVSSASEKSASTPSSSSDVMKSQTRTTRSSQRKATNTPIAKSATGKRLGRPPGSKNKTPRAKSSTPSSSKSRPSESASQTTKTATKTTTRRQSSVPLAPHPQRSTGRSSSSSILPPIPQAVPSKKSVMPKTTARAQEVPRKSLMPGIPAVQVELQQPSSGSGAQKDDGAVAGKGLSQRNYPQLSRSQVRNTSQHLSNPNRNYAGSEGANRTVKPIGRKSIIPTMQRQTASPAGATDIVDPMDLDTLGKRRSDFSLSNAADEFDTSPRAESGNLQRQSSGMSDPPRSTVFQSSKRKPIGYKSVPMIPSQRAAAGGITSSNPTPSLLGDSGRQASASFPFGQQGSPSPLAQKGLKSLPQQASKALPQQGLKSMSQQGLKSLTQGLKSLPQQGMKSLPFQGLKSPTHGRSDSGDFGGYGQGDSVYSPYAQERDLNVDLMNPPTPSQFPPLDPYTMDTTLHRDSLPVTPSDPFNAPSPINYESTPNRNYSHSQANLGHLINRQQTPNYGYQNQQGFPPGRNYSRR